MCVCFVVRAVVGYSKLNRERQGANETQCARSGANIDNTLTANTALLHVYTRTFNGPFSGTTQVSRYQKGKTNLDFTEARDCE